MPDPATVSWDWLSAQQRLKQGRVSDPSQDAIGPANVPDWYWAQQRARQAQTLGLMPQPQDIEALPFGSLGDPVSQLAFLAAPGLLRGGKMALDELAQPGPSSLMRGGMFGSQRGNLGRPPMNATGEVLPESMVRDETGQLQRLYHGTSRVFPDFEMAHSGSGAGGDLYGPGIYMTESPEVAGGSTQELSRGYMGYASAGWNPDYAAGLQATQKQYQDSVQMFAQEIQRLEAQAAQPGSSLALQQNISKRLAQQKERLALQQYQLSEVEAQLPEALREGPNVRSVYADLKRPFAIDKRVGSDAYQALGSPSGYGPNSGGAELYRNLVTEVGSKEAANKRLAELGFDGITHIGGMGHGQPHRVYIAFSPDTVYPSVNVDALRGLSTQYPQ